MRTAAPFALLALVLAGCGGSGKDAHPPADWKVAAAPRLPGAGLLAGVSCTSPAFCVAVGSRFARLVSHTLVEQWDGTSWRVVPTTAAADGRSGFAGVACTSPSFCVAVGNHFTDAGSRGLLEVWNGRAWRVTPATEPAEPHVYSAVACASRELCVAVGTTRSTRPQAVVQVWRGRSWAAAGAPAYRGTSFGGVSCAGPAFCVVVGQHSRGTVVSTAAASWSGARWRLERSPSIGVFSNLGSVACVSRDWCVAVGGHFHGQGTQTLVLRREGTWTLRPSPSRSFMSTFTGVACVSESACVAVGTQRDAAANRGLAAGWDGTAWTFAAVPNPPGTDVLAGVSCVPGWCVAVGSSGPTFGVGSKPVVLSAAR
jgi:hypothetical protein